MADVPDPAVDFEGCIEALFAEAKREHDSIPPGERSAFYLEKALLNLVRVYEIDGPEFLIQAAWHRTRRHLRIARSEARERRAATRRTRPPSANHASIVGS